MKQRQATERSDMYRAYAGRPRYEICEQRKILATRHAYEAVLLKEAQKNERDDFHKFNPGFTATYEQWLRNRGHDGEAEAWRHRKDENYFRLELSGEGEPQGDIDIKGLPEFKAAAAWRGTTRFYRDGTPGITAFVDTGQKIRVCQNDDETILAALQLGQRKWSGVQVNGTDEYKRRCVEIAALHGIRITNPELCDVKQQKEHDTARRAKAPKTVTAEQKPETVSIREAGSETPDTDPKRTAGTEKSDTRPMRLAERQKANAGTIAALRSRQKEIEGTLNADAKAIADATVEKLKETAGEKRKRLEAAKTVAASAVRNIEENPPAKGLFGFGYSARKAEWDKLLKTAKSDDVWARKDLEEHDKNLDAAISKAVESSKEAAMEKNTEAVKELEAIETEIEKLNGDVTGICNAARSLLRKGEYFRFPDVRFTEKNSAWRGEILGVAEYNGYAVVLQDGPTERFETGKKNTYGDPETVPFYIVWAYEIGPERVAEMEALTGYVTTIATDGRGEIELTDIRTKNQEWERSRNRGFIR
jgi:hypothetical protein